MRRCSVQNIVLVHRQTKNINVVIPFCNQQVNALPQWSGDFSVPVLMSSSLLYIGSLRPFRPESYSAKWKPSRAAAFPPNFISDALNDTTLCTETRKRKEKWSCFLTDYKRHQLWLLHSWSLFFLIFQSHAYKWKRKNLNTVNTIAWRHLINTFSVLVQLRDLVFASCD